MEDEDEQHYFSVPNEELVSAFGCHLISMNVDTLGIGGKHIHIYICYSFALNEHITPKSELMLYNILV